MEIKDFTYVLTIAEHQGITKAAEQLYLTQPALSIYLKNLEDRLGVPLFKRVGKKFILTYAGEKFVEEGRRVLRISTRLEKELVDIRENGKGELRIGMPLLRGITLLPATLPAFRREYPNVKVTIYEEDDGQLESLVLDGEIDLAIFNRPIDNRNLNHIQLSTEEIVLCACQEHPLARQASTRPGCRYPWVDIRHCREEAFILNYPAQRTWQIAQQIFAEAGFEPKVVLQVRSLMTTVALCAEGLGMCFSSERYIKNVLPGVRPVAFSIGNSMGDPALQMNLVASHRRDAHLTIFARRFIQLCQELYQIA